MSAFDVLLVIVLMATLFLGLFISYFVVDTIDTTLMNTTNNASLVNYVKDLDSSGNYSMNLSASFDTVMTGTDTILHRLDYFGFGCFCAFVIGIMILAWLTRSHPVFSIVFVIVDIIAVLCASIITYVWDTVVMMPVFGSTISHFPICNHIIENLPYYAVVIGVIALIVTYAKPGGAR